MTSRQDLTYEMLPTINRNLLLIGPTAVFLEWAKRYPSVDHQLTLDELLEDNASYLIPEQDGDPDSWIERNYKIIFEIELDGWCQENCSPQG